MGLSRPRAASGDFGDVEEWREETRMGLEVAELIINAPRKYGQAAWSPTTTTITAHLTMTTFRTNDDERISFLRFSNLLALISFR